MTALAGHHEVWTATHGRAARYHASIDGVAACRPRAETWRNRSVIVLGNFIAIEDVPTHMRCRRNGCRQIFDRVLSDRRGTNRHGDRKDTTP